MNLGRWYPYTVTVSVTTPLLLGGALLLRMITPCATEAGGMKGEADGLSFISLQRTLNMHLKPYAV